jgi:hypothetical protein
MLTFFSELHWGWQLIIGLVGLIAYFNLGQLFSWVGITIARKNAKARKTYARVKVNWQTILYFPISIIYDALENEWSGGKEVNLNIPRNGSALQALKSDDNLKLFVVITTLIWPVKLAISICVPLVAGVVFILGFIFIYLGWKFLKLLGRLLWSFLTLPIRLWLFPKDKKKEE